MNPRHPLIVKLLAGSPPLEVDEGAKPFTVAKEIEDAAWMLLDTATMHGGFPLQDPEAHTARITKFLQSALEVSSLDLEDEIEVPEEDEEPPEADMSDFDGLNMGDFDGLNMDAFDTESLDLD